MNAYTENFSKMFSQADSLTAPMAKFNQVAASNLEKMIELQISTMQKYASYGVDSIKAAASVTSPTALQEYLSQQMETANAVRQEMLSDFKAFNELGVSIREDMANLTEANVKELKTAANKATKKAA